MHWTHEVGIVTQWKKTLLSSFNSQENTGNAWHTWCTFFTTPDDLAHQSRKLYGILTCKSDSLASVTRKQERRVGGLTDFVGLFFWLLDCISWKDTPHNGSDFRPILQIQYPPQIYSHPGFTLSRISIFKAFAGTNWDQLKETLLITCMSLIRSLSMYAAPIGSPTTHHP